MDKCLFCTLQETDMLAEDKLARAFFDKFPVNLGHVLIIPKRHIVTLFEATPGEIASIGNLLKGIKVYLDERFCPDGYNIGINQGAAAGQTIFHLHIHVIPRYHGDVLDPRGGIRKIKKSLGPYVGETED